MRIFHIITAFVFMLFLSVNALCAGDSNDCAYTINAKVVCKETKKPLEAECYLCHQEGDELVQLCERAYSESGEISFKLSQKPRYRYMALYVCPLTNDSLNLSADGKMSKNSDTDYYTRFVPLNLPEKGNEYTMPLIEMERCYNPDKFCSEEKVVWPHPLPPSLQGNDE